jgi:hypothetical protein
MSAANATGNSKRARLNAPSLRCEYYRKLLDQRLLDAFGTMPWSAITADHVRAWHAGLTAHTPILRTHPE